MKRRQALIAGGLALGGVAAISGASATAALFGHSFERDACALVPLANEGGVASASVSELQILGFLPAEVASSVRRIDFDVDVADDDGTLRTIYAWQARRAASGATSCGSRMRMRFAGGTLIQASATVVDAQGTERMFAGTLPVGHLLALATARRSTGAPPRLQDLWFDPVLSMLRLLDGSPRDFDALLLRTR